MAATVKRILLFCLFAYMIVSTLCITDPLVIQTKKGPVKGITETSSTGKTVDSWYGIPYAQPPVGDLRFRHPHPLDKWHGIKDATQLPNSCWQISDHFFGDFEGSTMWNANTNKSEDCLYISVIVPKPRPKNAAVLVWIYGGGFYSGTSTLDVYDYRTFAAEENIILVAPQYRVASLGFLYMGTADVPGNTGLFDQLMALEWIRDNIEYFGGNKENVTLFGESAGAVSVSMLLLSPLSRNLFSQAIMQSGTATVPWGIMSKEQTIIRGLSLAEAVGCPHDRENISQVVDCLRKTDPNTLVSNEMANAVCDFPFVPIIDGSFFDDHPIKSLQNGNFKKTKILLGSNSEEGFYFIMYFLHLEFPKVDRVEVDKTTFRKSVKKLFPTANNLSLEAILYEYTPWLNPDDGDLNRDAVDKMIGDYHFTCNVNEFAYYYANAGNNVYMYYYLHRSSQSKWPKWTGVLHGDEINYIFGQPLNPDYDYTTEEKDLSKRIMRYWANFARTGDPNQGEDHKWASTYWPIYTVTGREYMTLDTNTTRIGRGPRLKQCAFWKNFIPALRKYNDAKGLEQCAGESVALASSATMETLFIGLLVCLQLFLLKIYIK